MTVHGPTLPDAAAAAPAAAPAPARGSAADLRSRLAAGRVHELTAS